MRWKSTILRKKVWKTLRNSLKCKIEFHKLKVRIERFAEKFQAKRKKKLWDINSKWRGETSEFHDINVELWGKKFKFQDINPAFWRTKNSKPGEINPEFWGKKSELQDINENAEWNAVKFAKNYFPIPNLQLSDIL